MQIGGKKIEDFFGGQRNCQGLFREGSLVPLWVRWELLLLSGKRIFQGNASRISAV